MYAIEEGHQRINDRIVKTFARSVTGHHTELAVEAGTNGYKGTPCRKAGSRTYMNFACLEGDFHFEPVTSDDGEIFGIEIACCGDAALDAVMKALDFARDVINDQRCDVDD